MGNQKHIWIVNYYTSPPKYDTHLRHLKFSEYLQKSGYKVTIFSSSFLRGENIDLVDNGRKFKKVSYGIHNFVHIKVKHYKENGLDRMFSIFQFAWRILRYRNKFEKPDIILHNIHEPFDYPIYWCSRKLKSKYIVEDWDLWTWSFIKTGLLKKGSLFSKFAFKIDEKLFIKADRIIFSMEGGVDYIKDMKWDIENGGKVDVKKIFYINNGVDLDDFNNNKCVNIINDDDLSDDSFKIIYLGSISMSNSIKELVDAAKIIHINANNNIKFLIYGDGNERELLENYCSQNNITNVKFKEKKIPIQEVPYVLSKSDLNILNYFKSFGYYGVSSGKLFQYLASGKPICCNIDMGKYDIISRCNLGIAREYDTSEEYADAIMSIYSLPKNEYDSMCNRVLDASKEFDYNVLSKKLINVIESLY